MRRVADMKHCGLHRTLSAFIYPDWLSARKRYEFDLRQLVKGVESGRLPPPGDEAVSEEAAVVAPPAQPAVGPPYLDSAPESEDKE